MTDYYGGAYGGSSYNTTPQDPRLFKPQPVTQPSPYQTTIASPKPAAAPTSPYAPAPTSGGGDPLRSQFMGIMGGTPATVQNLLAKQSQLQAAGYQLIPNATRDASGQPTNYDVRLPNGEVVDVIQNAAGGGGGAWQWYMGQAQTPYGSQNGGTQGPAAGSSTMNWNQYNSPTAHSGILDQVWNQLSAQAKQGTNINTNDPTFRKQADTYAAAMERSRRNGLADNAERDNAQGLGNSGAHTAEDRLVNEHAAQASAGFEADLAGRELANRRAEIQSALQMAMAAGNSEQQRALTEKLGMLDMQLREKMSNNSLGFDYTNLEAQQNRAALMALLGGGS